MRAVARGTVIGAVEFKNTTISALLSPTKLVAGTWKTELSLSLPFSMCRKMEMEMNLWLISQTRPKWQEVAIF